VRSLRLHDKRDDISAYALRIGERPPVIQCPCHLAWMASGRCPVFSQVVKTTQSRERTERTLLKALSQYCGPIKVARCGFPWEKTTKRPVASVYTHCEIAYGDFCSPQAGHAGRGNAADRRDPSLLMSHYSLRSRVITPTSADAFPVVGGRCTGGARRCKAKQGRRGKTALTFGFLLPQ
jgi:hypothetical protein